MNSAHGRHFIHLAQLSAGATPIGIGVSPASTWTGRGDTTLSIAGGRESNNSFLVNGIETRNARFGNAGIRPSIDAIQEVKIQRSTFGAEFGRSAAIINTTIKSGTNQWHGSVFEFNRDERFGCQRLLPEPHNRDKPPFNQNNFGTAVGGTLVIPSLYDGRNRTFGSSLRGVPAEGHVERHGLLPVPRPAARQPRGRQRRHGDSFRPAPPSARPTRDRASA